MAFYSPQNVTIRNFKQYTMSFFAAVSGAKITCSGTEVPDTPGYVTGTTDMQTTGSNDSILTEADIVKGENLKNFTGNCKFLPSSVMGVKYFPCQMMPTGGWTNTSKAFGDTEEKILRKYSMFNCAAGGKVQIQEAGQAHIDIGELAAFFKNGYSMDDIESMMANGWTLEYMNIAVEMYNFSIDYKKVRINDNANGAELNARFNENGSRPYVAGNSILSDSPLGANSFIHELMHIHQFQNDGLGFYCDRIGHSHYYYERKDINEGNGGSFDDYGVEQQAEIMKDLFIYRNYDGNFPVTFTEKEKGPGGTDVITRFEDQADMDAAIDEYEKIVHDTVNAEPGSNYIPDVVTNTVVGITEDVAGEIESTADGIEDFAEDLVNAPYHAQDFWDNFSNGFGLFGG